MKRYFLMLVILIFTVSVCSCGGAQGDLLPFFAEDEDTLIDCDGKTFNFATPGPSEWYWDAQYDGVPTLVMDKMMDRYDEAMEEFNMDFSVDFIDHSNLPVLFASGDNIPEMLYVSSRYAYGVYKMGVLAPLESISTIDINDIKWGDHDFIQHGKYDGHFYGFFPWHWQFVPQYCGAVIFNGEMIGDYNGINPYEMLENGAWTWDNWEEELRRYAGVDESGVQRWGVLLSTRFAARGAIFSNGGNIVDIDENGNYLFGLKSRESIEALEFMSELVSEGLANSRYLVKDSDFSAFSFDKLAPYFVGESFYGTSFSDAAEIFKSHASSALDYYGFIPFPTGPNGDPEKDMGSYIYRNCLLLYVTSMADIEADNIGSIIDFIFEPLEDSPEMAWKEYLDMSIFSEKDHEKSTECFVKAIDNISYDHSAQMSDSSYEYIDRILDQIVSGEKSISEALASVESTVMAEFD